MNQKIHPGLTALVSSMGLIPNLLISTFNRSLFELGSILIQSLSSKVVMLKTDNYCKHQISLQSPLVCHKMCCIKAQHCHLINIKQCYFVGMATYCDFSLTSETFRAMQFNTRGTFYWYISSASDETTPRVETRQAVNGSHIICMTQVTTMD